VELGREHAQDCSGKALGVFDGGFALRSVVRPLVTDRCAKNVKLSNIEHMDEITGKDAGFLA